MTHVSNNEMLASSGPNRSKKSTMSSMWRSSGMKLAIFPISEMKPPHVLRRVLRS